MLKPFDVFKVEGKDVLWIGSTDTMEEARSKAKQQKESDPPLRLLRPGPANGSDCADTVEGTGLGARNSKVIAKPIGLQRRWKAGVSHLLNVIPVREYELLVPLLRPMTLEAGTVLYEYGSEILDCYFVSSALASCFQVMQNGDSVEVGLIGSEGLVGHSALLQINFSSVLVSLQVPGEVIKVDAATLRNLMPQLPVLEKMLFRFAHLQYLQAQQIAACNGLHEIEKRLAFWILATQDRVHADPLPLTHDLLADMLGSRRASITVAASALQNAGMIQYRRGKLHVLEREKLEQAACECYANTRNQLQSYVQSFESFRPYNF